MRMFGMLIKNELVKIFRKTSTIVLICVLAGITVLFSLIDDDDFDGSGYSYTPQQMIENNNADMLHSDADVSNGFVSLETKAYNDGLCRKLNGIIEQAIEAGVKDMGRDWRSSYVNSAISAAYEAYRLRCFIDGTLPEEMSSKSDYYVDKNGFDSDTIAVPDNLEKAEEQLADCEKIIADNMKIVVENDYSVRYASDAQEVKTTYEMVKDNLKRFESELAGSKEKDAFEKLNANIIKCYDEFSSIADKSIREKYPYDSVEQKEFEAALDKASACIRTGINITDRESMLDEIRISDEYTITLPNGKISAVNDYGDYLSTCAETAEQHLESVMIIGYALQNGVYEMISADSTRANLIPITSLYAFFAFFGLFVACGIVASEYSKKTINLLLIRPVSRGKILFSKYASCLIVAVGTTVACVLICILFSCFRYGFSDIFRPYLYMAGGAVKEIPFLIWFLWKMCIASLGVIFFTTLTFFFSTVAKNTAVAVIISVAVYYASSVAGLVLKAFFPLLGVYLPFSYMNMWSVAFSGMPDFGETSIVSMITTGYGNLAYGSLLIVAICVALYFGAHAVFARRDVK